MDNKINWDSVYYIFIGGVRYLVYDAIRFWKKKYSTFEEWESDSDMGVLESIPEEKKAYIQFIKEKWEDEAMIPKPKISSTWGFMGKINLYPELIDPTNMYDDVKVHPCKVTGTIDKAQIEECPEEEAEFYGVYGYALGEKYDGLHCIADCENKETAEKLKELLMNFAQNYRQINYKDSEGSPFFEG